MQKLYFKPEILRWLSSREAAYTCTERKCGVETTIKQSNFFICWSRYGREKHSPYSTTGELLKALIASPATTLLNEFDSFTFSAPKILANIPVNSGIFDEPPVFTTASIS